MGSNPILALINNCEMIIINNITTYRDGGTIAIDVHLYFNHFKYKGEICFDRRIGITDGKLWFGYPDKEGSSIIENKYIIDIIKNGLESYKKAQNFNIETILNNF